MISKLHSSDGKIIAYAEWQQVAQSGMPKYKGEYIWLNDIWVHSSREHHKYIARLIRLILRVCPEAEYCYWRRKKYDDRISKLYTRKRFEKIVSKLER